VNRARTASILAAMVAVAMAGCKSGQSDVPTTQGPSTLQIEDLVVGTGATAAAGDTISVNYVGTFLDGRKFDASADHGGPYTFQVGAGKVIQGWDQGIPGMRVGGKRRLTIPSNLAYGSNGSGPIPPNTPLRFEVDLVAIAGK
jgi:FKBP-type peptidyl-prolyl cis-trans isomerase FkpA